MWIPLFVGFCVSMCFIELMKPKKFVDKIIIKMVGDVFHWHYTSAECKTSYASKCEAVTFCVVYVRYSSFCCHANYSIQKFINKILMTSLMFILQVII